MKKLFVVLSMAVSLASHGATITKKLICENTTTIFTALTSKYGEVPIFAGAGTDDDSGTHIVTLVNTETGTWTMLQIRNDVACFLATGDGATFKK